MPSALFLSPHLDDAALSCGGLAARLAAQGWRVTLVTLFTASVPNPQGFALHQQTSKGVPPHVDYMALRRREDVEAARYLGVSRVVHLPLPDAPHRGYSNPDALFGNILPYDEIDQPLIDHLHRLAGEERPDLILAPLAIGGHVDHRMALRAVQQARLPGVHAFWRDVPYVMRRNAMQAQESPDAPWEVAVEVTDFLRRRVQACAAYRSQLGHLFGGEARMAETLVGFARHEAAVAKLPGRAVEVVACRSKADAEFLQRAVTQSGGGGQPGFPASQAPPPPMPYGAPPNNAQTQRYATSPAPPRRDLPGHGAPPSRPIQTQPQYQGDGHTFGSPSFIPVATPASARAVEIDMVRSGATNFVPLGDPSHAPSTSGDGHRRSVPMVSVGRPFPDPSHTGLHNVSQPRTISFGSIPQRRRMTPG